MNYHNIYEINKYFNNKLNVILASISRCHILFRSSYLFEIKGHLDIEDVLILRYTKIPNKNTCLNMKGSIGKTLTGYINMDDRNRKLFDITKCVKICENVNVVKNINNTNLFNIISIKPRFISLRITCSSYSHMDIPNTVTKMIINYGLRTRYEIIPKSVKCIQYGNYCRFHEGGPNISLNNDNNTNIYNDNIKSIIFNQNYRPICGLLFPKNLKKISFHNIYQVINEPFLPDSVKEIKIYYLEHIKYFPKSLKIIYYVYDSGYNTLNKIPKNVKVVKI